MTDLRSGSLYPFLPKRLKRLVGTPAFSGALEEFLNENEGRWFAHGPDPDDALRLVSRVGEDGERLWSVERRGGPSSAA